MVDIEVELKLIISDEKYNQLKDFFDNNAIFVRESEEETHYLDCDEDIRLYQSEDFAKICLKQGGDCHSQIREETKIKFDKNHFKDAEKIFSSLGYNAQIKWFRKRLEYKWQDINVMLDKTREYANILELEIVTTKKDQNKALNTLKQIAKELEIEITPREEFDKKYEYYRNNWKTLTNQE